MSESGSSPLPSAPGGKGRSSTVSLRNLLEGQRVIWVTVDSDGKARHSVPWGLSGIDVYGGTGTPSWVDILGSPIEPTIGWAADFLARHPDFVALVSALLETPELDGCVQALLFPRGGRELDATEYDVLRELGMEVPMGEWARREKAAIFLVGNDVKGRFQ